MTGTSTSEIAVNVLGPLRVTYAGNKVNLGGLQQRRAGPAAYRWRRRRDG